MKGTMIFMAWECDDPKYAAQPVRFCAFPSERAADRWIARAKRLGVFRGRAFLRESIPSPDQAWPGPKSRKG